MTGSHLRPRGIVLHVPAGSVGFSPRGFSPEGFSPRGVFPSGHFTPRGFPLGGKAYTPAGTPRGNQIGSDRIGSDRIGSDRIGSLLSKLTIQYLLSRGASPQELTGLSDWSCNICAGPRRGSPPGRASRSPGGRKASEGDLGSQYALIIPILGVALLGFCAKWCILRHLI